MFHDINNIVEYIEHDATSWLWPNYISELQTCDPDLPSFVLDSQYIIKLSESNSMNFTFTAFDDWRDAKFLFRVWSDIPSSNVTWVSPPWVSFNENAGNFTIDTSKIASVQNTNLVFQSQLIGFSFISYNLDNTISTFSSSFNFTNDNWVVAGSYSNWYVVYQQMANFTMNFEDTEGDTVLLKKVDSGSLSVFIQRQSKSVYTLLATWYDETISETAVVLAYTDVYHTDIQFWTNISINVNAFKSEPPKFVEQPNNLVVDLWQQDTLRFGLPAISDPDSTAFNVSDSQLIKVTKFFMYLFPSTADLFIILLKRTKLIQAILNMKIFNNCNEDKIFNFGLIRILNPPNFLNKPFLIILILY